MVSCRELGETLSCKNERTITDTVSPTEVHYCHAMLVQVELHLDLPGSISARAQVLCLRLRPGQASLHGGRRHRHRNQSERRGPCTQITSTFSKRGSVWIGGNFDHVFPVILELAYPGPKGASKGKSDTVYGLCCYPTNSLTYTKVPRSYGISKLFKLCQFTLLLYRQNVNPGAISPEDVERYKQAMARPGSLTAALNYYRAFIDGNTWRKTPGR